MVGSSPRITITNPRNYSSHSRSSSAPRNHSLICSAFRAFPACFYQSSLEESVFRLVRKVEWLNGLVIRFSDWRPRYLPDEPVRYHIDERETSQHNLQAAELPIRNPDPLPQRKCVKKHAHDKSNARGLIGSQIAEMAQKQTE